METRNHYRSRICIVGSHDLEGLPTQLIDFISRLGPGSLVMLRSPRDKEPGRFEQMVAKVCGEMWVAHAYFKPGGGGRSATFERDIGMVSMSTCVMAFFATDEMSGGTEHVVDKAVDQRVPVASYGIRDDLLVQLGSYNPDDLVLPELAL